MLADVLGLGARGKVRRKSSNLGFLVGGFTYRLEGGRGGTYVVPMFHVEHSSGLTCVAEVAIPMFHVEHSSSSAFIREPSCQKQ